LYVLERRLKGLRQEGAGHLAVPAKPGPRRRTYGGSSGQITIPFPSLKFPVWEPEECLGYYPSRQSGNEAPLGLPYYNILEAHKNILDIRRKRQLPESVLRDKTVELAQLEQGKGLCSVKSGNSSIKWLNHLSEWVKVLDPGRFISVNCREQLLVIARLPVAAFQEGLPLTKIKASP
jgi:hypothetical protein